MKLLDQDLQPIVQMSGPHLVSICGGPGAAFAVFRPDTKANSAIGVNGGEGNMLKRTVLSAFCAAAMLVTGVAYAQNSATLTLRSGEKVSGDLIDLGGVGFTMRVSGSGDRELSSNEVARIVLARPDNVATGTAGVAATPSVPGAITVQANQAWTSTGRTVRKGQRLTFTTTGEIQLSDNANDVANANGA